jgi:predicted nucleotidyltransferase
MHRDDVISLLTSHRDEIQAFGVKSLALFGSVSRDQATPDSDVDLLVSFQADRRSTPIWTLNSFWRAC